jgi:hypothetical protein
VLRLPVVSSCSERLDPACLGVVEELYGSVLLALFPAGSRCNGVALKILPDSSSQGGVFC